MTETKQDISVIICAYTEERWDDLVAAVESVRQQTFPASEIIIVIDHNPQLLRRVQDHIPGVFAAENIQARGLSGARNSGITIARGHIVAFLDDDATATPDWLKSLGEAFDDQQVLGVGGCVIPLWIENEPAWLPEEFYWVVGCSYRGMPQTATKIRNPIGANMSFRREIFNHVGGFRSDVGRIGTLPLGCEETELCIRAHQRWPQGKILYLPQASVSHRVPGNRTCWRYFCTRCYSEGLSKAVVTWYIGAKDGLASERVYTCRTLPQGVVNGMMDGLYHLDLSGFLRAGAIIAGLTMTIAGYLVGRFFSQIATPRNIVAAEGIHCSESKVPQTVEAQ